MNCEKCGNPVKRTLSDNCVSRIKLYKKVAYYCDFCDEIFILAKYKNVLDKHKYDDELTWLREQNPRLQAEKQQEKITFIENAGGCICTKSILSGKTPVKWCFRNKSVVEADSGWRFIGKDDTEAYINVHSNNVVVDFNTVANIEPAVLAIYNMPVGTDLYIDKDLENKIRFFKTGTNEEIKIKYD